MKKYIFLFVIPLMVLCLSTVTAHAEPAPQLPSNLQKFVVIEGGQPTTIPDNNIIEFNNANNTQIQSSINSKGMQVETNGIDILMALAVIPEVADKIDSYVGGESYQAYKYEIMNPDDPELKSFLGWVGGDLEAVIAVDYLFTQVIAVYDESGNIAKMYSSATDALIDFSDWLLGIDTGEYTQQGVPITETNLIGGGGAKFAFTQGRQLRYNFRGLNGEPCIAYCDNVNNRGIHFISTSTGLMCDGYNRSSSGVFTYLNNQNVSGYILTNRQFTVDGVVYHDMGWNIGGIDFTYQIPQYTGVVDPTTLVQYLNDDSLKTVGLWNYENGLLPLGNDWYNVNDLQGLQNGINQGKLPNYQPTINSAPFAYPDDLPQPMPMPLGPSLPVPVIPDEDENNPPVPIVLPETFGSTTAPPIFDLETRFPFCIPFELKEMFESLKASAEAPHWEIPLKVDLPMIKFEHTFVIDLQEFEPLAVLFRRLQVIIFIVALAVYSYGKFFGGGSN